MDPICHTLVGASLAQAGLKRLTPLAAATLLVGANLPDVDVVTYAMGEDASLFWRRGWTHGVLALALWPLVLAGTMLVIDSVRRRKRLDAPRARAGWLLALSALAVWSHPALDWLNAYGIRLLMPFDGRWFYGDSAFIVDPWMWVLAGAAVVIATSRRTGPTLAWLALGAATTALVWAGPGSTSGVKAAWTGALAAIAAVRLWAGGPRLSTWLARACLVAFVLYAALLRVVTVDLSARAAGWLRAQGIAAREVAALPVPGQPLQRDIVAVGDGRYYFVSDGWTAPRPAFSAPPAETAAPSRVIDAALAAPQVQGLAGWLRFPSYSVVPRPDGYRVYVRDVRFWRPGDGALVFGGTFVDLDRDLRPRPTPAIAGAPPDDATEARATLELLSDPCLGALIHLQRDVARRIDRSFRAYN